MRVAALALAVIAAAWFAVGVRQAQDTSRASAILATSGLLPPAQAHRASELLRSAGFLNPDRALDVLRARVDRARGDLRGARAILKRVVASEPDNLQAWLALAQSSAGDPHDFFLAAFRIEQLVPKVPRAR